jgi:hypothetical protein
MPRSFTTILLIAAGRLDAVRPFRAAPAVVRLVCSGPQDRDV